MPVKVTHRPDGLLEMRSLTECPSHLRNTFVDTVTWPTHRAAYKFLQEKVVNKTFANREQLQTVLDEWPQFRRQEGVPERRDFQTLSIVGNEITFPPRNRRGGLPVAFVQDN